MSGMRCDKLAVLGLRSLRSSNSQHLSHDAGYRLAATMTSSHIAIWDRRTSGHIYLPSSSPRRSITTTPSRAQSSKAAPADFPTNPQSHYDYFPSTLPDGPPPAGTFKVDLKALRKEFLQLQARAHPDLHPPEFKTKAEALSSRVNEAYKTLQDPLRRALHILSINGQGDVDAELEGVGMFGAEEGQDKELLMVVMEAREVIEEAADESELDEIKMENDARIDESVGVLEKASREEDWEQVKKECVRLRYWMNIKQTLGEWEPGKGVPNVSH